MPSPAQPSLEAKKLRIDLGVPGARQTIEREVFVRTTPDVYARQSDATAVLNVYNARSNALEHEPLTIALPEGVRTVQRTIAERRGDSFAS